MSKLTESLNRDRFEFSYADIPRGTHAAIDAGIESVRDAWESSNMLQYYDAFSQKLGYTKPIKDDLSQTPLQGLKTFSSRATPPLYEGAVGQGLFSPIMMQNDTESIPVLTLGEAAADVGDGTVEDISRAGQADFVNLKLPDGMVTTSDKRSDTWLARTTPQIAARLWQQIHIAQDEKVSRQIIEKFTSVTTGTGTFSAFGNTHPKKAHASGKGTWNMDTFSDVEKVTLDNSIMATDCLLSTTAYNKMKKQTDFKRSDFFQAEMDWNRAATAGGVKGPNGWNWHVSKYVTGEKAYVYDRNHAFTYGIMNGFNGVAEPWRDVQEQKSGLHVKTWIAYSFIDPTRIIVIS